MSSSILLICAVLASLATGVLMAYGICVAMFHLFRTHSLQVQSRRVVRQTSAARS